MTSSSGSSGGGKRPYKSRPRKPRLNIPGRSDYKPKPRTGPAYDLPNVYAKPNVHDAPKLQLRLMGGSGGDPYIGQIQTLRLSPPIADTFDDVSSNAQMLSCSDDRKSNRDFYDELRTYVEGEDSLHPYSDNDITAHLLSKGYEVDRREVCKARSDLGIRASYERIKKRTGGEGNDF